MNSVIIQEELSLIIKFGIEILIKKNDVIILIK